MVSEDALVALSTTAAAKQAVVELSASRTFQSLDALGSKAVDLVRDIVGMVGAPIELQAARVNAWKLNNLRAIAQQVDQHLPEGVPTGSPPMPMALALVEGASHAEDTELQAMWAKLLAASLVEHAVIDILMIDVVRKLSPCTASVFRHFAEHARRGHWPHAQVVKILAEEIQIDTWRVENSLGHLLALGLLGKAPCACPFVLTRFGVQLLNALHFPGESTPTYQIAEHEPTDVPSAPVD